MGNASGALVYRNGGGISWLGGLVVYTRYGRRCPDFAVQLLVIIYSLRASTMAPQGRMEASRHPYYYGSGPDHCHGMAGNWSAGTMGIRGLHADSPTAGRGPDPVATMVVAAAVDNMADAPAYAWPHRSSVLKHWSTVPAYCQANQRRYSQSSTIDKARPSTQDRQGQESTYLPCKGRK